MKDGTAEEGGRQGWISGSPGRHHARKTLERHITAMNGIPLALSEGTLGGTAEAWAMRDPDTHGKLLRPFLTVPGRCLPDAAEEGHGGH